MNRALIAAFALLLVGVGGLGVVGAQAWVGARFAAGALGASAFQEAV